jgi:dCMP deaminase
MIATDPTPDWLTDSWARDALRRAYDLASGSPDTSTQNGAVAYAADGTRLGVGSNHFTRGTKPTADLLERPKKYAYIEHAERNAIYSCLRFQLGWPHVLVCPWAACADCARAIVESGIRHLVRHQRDDATGRWAGSIVDGDTMMASAGVNVITITGELGGCAPILFAGQEWTP